MIEIDIMNMTVWKRMVPPRTVGVTYFKKAVDEATVGENSESILTQLRLSTGCHNQISAVMGVLNRETDGLKRGCCGQWALPTPEVRLNQVVLPG
jgi:hypothetical protein